MSGEAVYSYFKRVVCDSLSCVSGMLKGSVMQVEAKKSDWGLMITIFRWITIVGLIFFVVVYGNNLLHKPLICIFMYLYVNIASIALVT